VIAIVAAGCTSADPVGIEVNDSVPFLQDATTGAGSVLRDGIEVVTGSRLLADPFPEERLTAPGGPDLDRGWTALAVVTGDARRVLDAYAEQATKLGLPTDTVDCVEVPQADAGVTAPTTACTAVSQSADGRNVYRLDFTRSSGLPGFEPVSHVWITHRLLAKTPSSPEPPGPGGTRAVSDPGTGRTLPWRPLPTTGQRFDPGTDQTAGFVVEEGSHLVGPPGVAAGDQRLGAPVAILRVDGKVDDVVDAYRRRFRPGYEQHRSSTQDGVRVDHWYWTNGDTATIDVFRRPGRPTWMRIWHTAGD
jgi:hypothetical protein